MLHTVRTIIIAAAAIVTAIAALALMPVNANDADNGRTIEVLRFRTLKLSLESNPTTGYSWQLISPADRKVLRLYYSKYRARAAKLVGSGGREEWKFRAMAPGTVVIKALYARPWERSAPPAKIFTLTIRVR